MTTANDTIQDRAEQVLTDWAELPITQRGIAGIFANRFDGSFPDGKVYRYDPRRGRWYGLIGNKWIETASVLDDLGKLIEGLCKDSKTEATKWLRYSVYRDVLTLAQESMTLTHWDSDDDVLGLPNGDIWYLDKGFGIPNVQGLPVTMYTANPIEYTTDMQCPIGNPCVCAWHTFLRETTGGDEDMQDSLQLAVGASVYGGNREHTVNVIAGDGGTGKSIFMNTVGAALGDYGGVAPSSVLASKGSEHPTGLAGIVNKRFVAVPEVNGAMWREETLKAISGGDKISVRYMRQDYFQADPKCTLWITTNEIPSLRMVDEAMRRRLRVWPFTHRPETVDKALGARLREPDTLGRVMQWCLEGAFAYTRAGSLTMCQVVKDATAQYFSDVDTIGAWLEARTNPSVTPELDTSAGAAYLDYKAWCEREGLRFINRQSWGVTMGRRVDKRHGKRGSIYAITLEVIPGDSVVTAQVTT